MASFSAITRRKPGRGKVYSVLGDHVACKLVGEESGDAFSVFEISVAPQSGPPPHVHLHEDEAYYVLNGSFDFLQGERTIRAQPGEFIHFSRRTLHTYRNTGSETGRLLAIYTPSGVEHYFEEMDRLARARHWMRTAPKRSRTATPFCRFRCDDICCVIRRGYARVGDTAT